MAYKPWGFQLYEGGPALLLRRVAALARRVDDQQYFAAKRAERDRLLHQIRQFVIEDNVDQEG